MSAVQLLVVFAVAFTAAAATLPSYVDVCPKNDPQLNTCFTNSLNKLRPHLIKGISELEVPPIDPLELSEVKVADILGDWIEVLLRNIKIRGAGEFKINSFKVNLKNSEFSGLIHIPNVIYEGDYDLDARVMHLSMKGKGNIKGNATGCNGHFVLSGDTEKRNGGKYFNFRRLRINLNVNQTEVSITGLVNGELVMADYVPVCQRDDPDINACVVNAIDKLRPTLMKGIPELEVPPIDPLEVSEVMVSPIPGQRVRVTASNIKVYGLEKTRVNRMNVNVRNQEFSGTVQIPNLMFEADYNVDAKFMQLSMKGKGAVTGNATDCRGDFVLRGKLVKRKNGNYVQFNKLNLNFNVERSHSHLEGFVSGDLVIGDAVNDQSDNSMNIWPLARPVVERSISEVLLEMANKIASHITYDEMFP